MKINRKVLLDNSDMKINRKVLMTIVFILSIIVLVNIFPMYARYKMGDVHYDRFSKGNDTYKGVEYCKVCHEEYFEQWNTSLHSVSAKEELYTEHMEKLKDIMGTELCYDCHDPRLNGEGVSCEICHGPGDTKMSSNRDSSFTDLCNRCHQFKNPVTGYELMTPYEEWLNSDAAKENKTCISCHMPVTNSSLDKSHFHGFYGIRAHPEIYNGTVKIKDIKLKDDGVVITVKNLVEGHYIPTGTPERSLKLELVTYSPNNLVIQKEEYIFQRECWAMKNMPMFVWGDTRLKNNEIREISFRLKEEPVKIKATLRFTHTTWSLPDNVDLVIDEKELKVEKELRNG